MNYDNLLQVISINCTIIWIHFTHHLAIFLTCFQYRCFTVKISSTGFKYQIWCNKRGQIAKRGEKDPFLHETSVIFKLVNVKQNRILNEQLYKHKSHFLEFNNCAHPQQGNNTYFKTPVKSLSPPLIVIEDEDDMEI